MVQAIRCRNVLSSYTQWRVGPDIKRHSPRTEGRRSEHKDSGKSRNQDICHVAWIEEKRRLWEAGSLYSHNKGQGELQQIENCV